MKDKKKILVISVIVMVLIVFILGTTYAFWSVQREQNGVNKLATGCLDLTLVSDTAEIVLENAYPITSKEGMKLVPYTFTITNTCDIFVSYEVSLNMLPTTTLNTQYVAAVLDHNTVQTLNQYEQLETIAGYSETRLLHNGSLSEGDSETFSLRLWVDEKVGPNDTDAMNKVFQAKVAVTARPSTYSPTEQGFTTLADAMLVNEYQSSSVESAKEKISSKQAPDFTKTAPIIDWQEVHANTTSTATATMINPNKNNSASATTDANSKVRFGQGYMFDSETGYYNIVDYGYYNPMEIADYDTTNYYYCENGSGVGFSQTDAATSYHKNHCTTLYKVISATGSETTSTGSSGTKFNMIKYTLTAYAYTQGEMESDKSDRGLYEGVDDNGTTYYYRGNVNNNYVKFANAYWRIIRLNGDGSIRLLYAGTTSTATGSDLSIGSSAYNSVRNNPAYVGYMYGSNLGVSYEENTKNEVDSTIKKKLDSWYKTNIVDKNLESYVADSVFCNDRELNSGDGVSLSVKTYYKGNQRYYTDNSPTYSCHQENDKFSVSPEKGNGALTYPIGLITVDELMYAGMANGYLNRMSYVYSSQHYWTISSSYFDASFGSSRGFLLNPGGYIFGDSYLTNSFGVRPVINLKSDAPITEGIGTANNPYVVG